METAIRWSPHSTSAEQRFLIVDVPHRALQLCRTTSLPKTGQPVRYDILATHAKVPIFRTFDWHPTNDRLVAVGLSSGEATVLRLGEEGTQDALSFPVRSQRLCNSVAFSINNYLAAGLDRVRNDFCLNIWDLNQCLPSRGTAAFGTFKHREEPINRLASSEPITSVKFFVGQPNELVTGVKGQFVRIYDLREPPGTPALQFTTKCVHNLTIDPLDENYFASCVPTKDTAVCIWDRRAGSRFAYSTFPPASSFVLNQSEPILEFKNVIDTSIEDMQPNIWSLRFCRTKRGCLGVLSSTGQFKIYETIKGYVPKKSPGKSRERSENLADPNAPEPLSIKRLEEVQYPFYHNYYGCQEERRVVSFDFVNFQNQYTSPHAINLLGDNEIQICDLLPVPVSMDWSNTGELLISSGPKGLDRTMAFNCSAEAVTIKRNGQITVISPKHEEKTVAESLRNIRARHMAEVQKKREAKSRSEGELAPGKNKSSWEIREDLLSFGPPGSKVRLGDALLSADVFRRRCQEGYLFNCEANVDIVSDDPWLQEIWRWIGHAKALAADDGMVYKGLDLSYIGVHAIIHEDLGPDLRLRHSSKETYNTTSLSDAIYNLVEALELPPFSGVSSSYPTHRQLALYICGAPLTSSALTAAIDSFTSTNQYTRAACLALMHSDSKRAYAILKAGHTPSYNILALGVAAVASHPSSDGVNSDWAATCSAIASELSDPYARAIMALVSSDSWVTVLRETSIPLLDRLTIALLNLPDVQLTRFLTDTLNLATALGDISALPLTGLTSLALPLLHNYHLTTHDIQTPILALSFACPKYIPLPSPTAQTIHTRNGEFTHPFPFPFLPARLAYRNLLQASGLPLQRVAFDVHSARLSHNTSHPDTQIPPPPRQISLACAYCTSDLSRGDNGLDSPSGAKSDVERRDHRTPNRNPLGARSKSSGTRCPKCGRGLMRCGVCTMRLGEDPASGGPLEGSKFNSRADADKKSKSKFGSESDPDEADEVMDGFITICAKCRHGFHFRHAKQWFSRHVLCPVPECDCECDQ